MDKKLLSVIVSIVLAALLAGCERTNSDFLRRGNRNSEAEAETEAVEVEDLVTTESVVEEAPAEPDTDDTAEIQEEKSEPLDLTGSWAQKGKEGDDSFQAGYIKDGIIEIFWVTDGGDSRMLYWSGSYEAPTVTTNEYSWNSANDKIKTETALMASGDDNKQFSYKDGELSYEVSMMGSTTKVTLVRSENDYTGFATAGGSSGSAQDGQPIELEDARYTVVQSDESCYVYYAVRIHNPNAEYAVEFPKITITAKAGDGSILSTEDQVLNAIAANDTIVYGNYLYYEGIPADTVDITAKNDDNDYMHQEGSGVIKQDELSITNVSENVSDYDTKYTGEVTNNSSVDLDNVCLIVIYKKGGEMLGGNTGFLDGLKSGETLPFEISGTSNIEHDSYEIYAVQW